MCGIFGTTYKSDFKPSADAIKHRGPDDSGSYIDPNLQLFQCRLSILDLSNNGHQPMFNERNDLAIVFNGEIYNYKEIRNDLILSGFNFKSDSDTEVLLKGYDKFGVDIFSKLRGMWAVAIYDLKKKELILARDHFGIKPLLYSMSGTDIVFGSEIKSIIPQIKKLTPNKEAYFLYYNFGYFPGADTSFEEIKKILPGEIIKFNLTTGEYSKMFTPLQDNEVENKKATYIDDETEAVNLIERELMDSVEKHFISDVPVGLLLSGGNDSSFLASLSKKAGKNPICYAVAVEDSPDSVYAEKVAAHLGLSLKTETITIDTFDKQYDQIWDILDQPTADVSFIPTSVVYSSVAEQAKVVLSGEGGDEMFGGYHRHQKFARFTSMDFKSLFPENLFAYKSKSLMDNINPVLSRLRDAMPRFQSLGSEYLIRSKTIDIPILSKKTLEYMNGFFDLHPYKNIIPPNLFFDLFMYLPFNLMYKGDMSSMAFGIESRVPFLDKKFFNSCLGLSPSLRLSASNLNKKIMKKSMEKFLPKELIYRKKSGFGIDIRKYSGKKITSDLNESILYHKKYSELFGLQEHKLASIIREENSELLLRKYPRFIFSLITNYKVMSKYWGK